MSSRGRKKTVDCYPMCRMHRACAAIGTAAEETAADRGPRIFGAYIREDAAGRRYLVDYEVTVRVEKDRIKARALDISTTGMLLHAELGCDESLLTEGTTLSLSFEITPGTLPEGYEMKIKDLGATVVRSFHKENAEGLFIGVQFAGHACRVCQ